MEAVPKLALISFELKTSPENTHFGPKLKQYIAEAYREDPDSYSNEIHQLEGLRSAAVRPTVDAAGLSAITRYFCQLRSMQSRFPMSTGQPVACTFTWKDLYAYMSCPLPDIRYEMSCILYNIGALHSHLGASEPRNTADSLKAACTHYQNAAWAFQCVREQFFQLPGSDICPEIMRLLQEICFAQAQECILEKSIQDTRKPSVIGAVATQVVNFYKNALSLLGPSAGTDNVHEIIGTKIYNNWHRYLSFKWSYIGCIVCLYQGMNAEEQQKMGERVAYYQHAVEKLAEARKLAKYIEPVQVTQEALTFTNDVVEGKRKAAKNENEFIYHEEVPDKALLVEMKPVCLVKALAVNLNDPEISGPDIFSRLVPMGAHEASSLYSEEKAKLLRRIVSQAEAKNTELTEFMSSLQLDQLEVLDSDQTIPQEIVDRCAAMNAKSEIIQTLVDSMNNLAEIISDVEHSLTEIKTLIQEETMKEKEFQKVMGPRPPSIVQTELSREYHKYQEAHARTNESNQVLHKAMTLHIANLKLLAQPLDVLETKIPSIENIEGLDRDTMNEMRRVVGKAREMQVQRDSLIQQLREAINSDDITSQLLARSTESKDEVFKQELEKHNPKVNIIDQNLAAQENIINKLTSLYASYGESRRMLSDVLRKREGLINALITSYDTCEELLGKSQKGQEFYKKLLHNVNQLLARLRSTCQVQEEERAQLLTKQTSKAATATPSYTPPLSSAANVPDLPPGLATSTGGGRKLKDYLPYMKNRGSRSATPQAQVDPMPHDTYYPESIYPTSIRPAPVGSEATDMTQMQLPDGVVMPPMQSMPNPHDRYSSPYAHPENDPHSVPPNYSYPTTSKPYEKPQQEINYGYSAYTPSQYSSHQVSDQQAYSNPYYSATHNNTTAVTDSQNFTNDQANMNPTNQYCDAYGMNQPAHVSEAQTSVSSYSTSQSDLNVNFAQMQVSVPKSEPHFGEDYSQTYYSVHYPHMSTPNMATYSHAPQNSNTSMVPSQIPSDYNSLNYPYSSESGQYSQQGNPTVIQSTADPQYSYAPTFSENSQGYTYTNTVSSTSNTSTAVPYSFSSEVNYNPTAAQIDDFDKPIKSHVTGEALSRNYQPAYHSYGPSHHSQAPNQAYQSANPTGPNQQANQTGYLNQTANPTGYPNQSANPTGYPNQPANPTGYPNQSDNPTGYPNQPANPTGYPNQPATPTGYPNQPANPTGYPNQPANPTGYPNQPATPTGYPNQPENKVHQLNQPTSYSGQLGDQTQQSQPTNYGSQPNNPTQLSNQPGNQSYHQMSYPNQSDNQQIHQPGNQTNQQTPTNYTSQPESQSYHPNQPTGYSNQPSNLNYTPENMTHQPGQPTNVAGYPNQQNQGQTYQNHPGYTFNATTGNYEYAYGSQNTNVYDDNSQSNLNPQATDKDPHWPPHGIYTSAGTYATVQSPSEVPQAPAEQTSNGQIYYNTPYGYLTTTNQAHEPAPQSQPDSTNYGANVNQSTYMQSGNERDTSVTYSSNQVSTPKENISEPSFEGQPATNPNTVNSHNTKIKQEIIEPSDDEEVKTETNPESAFDLLSGIDFTVEHKPLMPEIKVPQISETAIKRPLASKVEPVRKVLPKEMKEEVVERPAKREIFTDPSLLNQFTQEVKNLQKLVDSLTNKMPSGLTLLDSKWKTFQDVQAKENMTRSKRIAKQHTRGNIVAEVVPFDDSRLTLKSDPDVYINASSYKQLAPWCIPIVISKNPSEQEYRAFWKAILEHKICCVVCLLSEIEMQGKTYWPTAKGQALELPDGLKVMLDEVTCTVHWTERKLTVSRGKTVLSVTHYQINVFPAKIVCSPLVLLADKILSQTYDNRLSNQLRGAWLQCEAGAGRSAILALLVMIMCQVRAGQLDLCEMLDAGCVSLCRHRTNVLEDTKYLADAYRTVLFYAQGVLCSGTTMFNGEAVSVPSGAAVLPPVPTSTPTPPSGSALKNKFSRESFEEMKQSPGLKSGDMKDPLNFLDPLWSLKKK